MNITNLEEHVPDVGDTTILDDPQCHCSNTSQYGHHSAVIEETRLLQGVNEVRDVVNQDTHHSLLLYIG